jgi:hypothetical protein
MEPALADMLASGVGSGALPFHPPHVSIQVAVPAATTALMAAAVAAATSGAGAGASDARRYKCGMTVSVDAARRQKTADKKRQRADLSDAAKEEVNEKRRAKRQTKQGMPALFPERYKWYFCTACRMPSTAWILPVSSHR